MPKFTLIAEHVDLYTGDSNGHKITYEFEVDHISHVLENIDYFIRGVGYHPDGILDYVPEDEHYGLHPEETDEWTQTLREDANAENPWPAAYYGHDLKETK